MKIDLKGILALLGLSTLLFQVNFGIRETRKVTPLHFVVQNTDGHAMLGNMAHDHVDTNSSSGQASAGTGTHGYSVAELNAISPQLGNLWNNTALILGANADGTGFGTTFAISQPEQNSALFVTNLHVVEPFCQISADVIADQVDSTDFKYSCQFLYVLHDITINTKTHVASMDNKQAWKSEVKSLIYFDKAKDLAVFKIAVPAEFKIRLAGLETDYSLVKPVFDKKAAHLVNENAVPGAVQRATHIPLDLFELYMISYSVSEAVGNEGNIQKSWTKGSSYGLRAYETDDKLGIIRAIRHSMEGQLGSSGSPLALSDGRVIGVNVSIVELTQYLANSGCAKEELETHKNFYASPTPFLKPVLLGNLNGTMGER